MNYSIKLLEDQKKVLEAFLVNELKPVKVAELNQSIADLLNSIETLNQAIKEPIQEEAPENQTNIFEQGA